MTKLKLLLQNSYGALAAIPCWPCQNFIELKAGQHVVHGIITVNTLRTVLLIIT